MVSHQAQHARCAAPAASPLLRPLAASPRSGLRAWVAAGAALAVGIGCTQNEPPKTPDEAPAAETTESAVGAAEAAVEAAVEAPSHDAVAEGSIHGLTLKNLEGEDTSLSHWSGKVLLVVNTASECGHTPQYKGLQALHTKYADQGFAVLGFPSNDFGGQEPGSAEEIKTFCTGVYGVTFPMFAKLKTKGEGQSPLYAMLSQEHGEPGWNFHKYLVDQSGRPVQAWESKIQPDSEEIAQAIEALLAAPQQ